MWSGKTPVERAEILLELADLIQANTPRARPRRSAATPAASSCARFSDVFMGAKFLRSMANYAANHFPWREDIPFRNFPFQSTNHLEREPIGVCVGIVPWNFPFTMAIWKIAMAMIDGQHDRAQAGERTRRCRRSRSAEVIAKSRIPKGVVNIIAGPGAQVGEALCKHKGVDKIAFTGSTEVGRRILEMAAQDIKKATMELGGKSANIVLDDADMEAGDRRLAVRGLLPLRPGLRDRARGCSCRKRATTSS